MKGQSSRVRAVPSWMTLLLAGAASGLLLWPGLAWPEEPAQADAIRAQVIADLQLSPSGEFSSDVQEQKDLNIRRTRALAALDAESAACYSRFAVNDCLAKVQARRRAALGELTRQQNVLDDVQRKERSQRAWQEQQRKRDARAAVNPEGMPPEASNPFAVDMPAPAELLPFAVPADPKATKIRAQPATAVRPTPRSSDANLLTPAQIARNRALYQQRLADQAAHRAEVQQRLASQPERPALPSPTEVAP